MQFIFSLFGFLSLLFVFTVRYLDRSWSYKASSTSPVANNLLMIKFQGKKEKKKKVLKFGPVKMNVLYVYNKTGQILHLPNYSIFSSYFWTKKGTVVVNVVFRFASFQMEFQIPGITALFFLGKNLEWNLS